jgi:hypothetical protein
LRCRLEREFLSGGSRNGSSPDSFGHRFSFLGGSNGSHHFDLIDDKHLLLLKLLRTAPLPRIAPLVGVTRLGGGSKLVLIVGFTITLLALGCFALGCRAL